MTIKIRKVKGGPLAKKLAEVKKLNHQKVEAGHFASQGEHSSLGMSYAEAMAYFHRNFQFPRKILSLLYFEMRDLKTPEMMAIKKQWLAHPDAEATLSAIGTLLRDKEVAMFGVVNEPFMPAAGDTKKTPLVETGELRDKTAYRTSLKGDIKEVG